MKKLYLLRGAPSAGKSTLVQHLKLTRYTISLTAIQDLYSTPTLGMTSNRQLTAYRRNATLKPSLDLMMQVLEKRMQDSQTTIIDAPNLSAAEIQPYLNLAQKYQYQVLVVNVGNKLNLHELLNRNSKREPIDQISEGQMRQSLHLMRNEQLPTACKQLTEKQFIKDLAVKLANVNQYHDILVIGDVQSCGSALVSALGNYKASRLYVLLGDYFDRGCEPVKVMQTLQKWSQYPNVILVRGNHELHLERFASGQSLTGKAFQRETLPALLKAGYTVKDVRRLLAHTMPVFMTTFHGKNICFTHAGLTSSQFKLQNRFSLQDDSFFTKGIGGYDYDLDTEFNQDHPNNLIQFHGHRNSFNYPVLTSQSQASFNLEQKAEHGNKLGAVLINCKQGKLRFTDQSVVNTIWNKDYIPFDQNSDQRLDSHVLLKSHKLQSKNLNNGLKLITVKPDYQDLSQWTDQMVQANNIVVDTGNHLIARSFPYPIKLTYCNQTSANTLTKLAHANLTVLFDLKTPLIIASYVKRLNQLLIYSPDAKNESMAITLFKEQVDIANLTNSLKELNYSLVFQLNGKQVELVTAVANTYQGKLNNKLAQTLAQKLNLVIIKTEDLNLNSQKHASKVLAQKVGQLQMHHANCIISIDNPQIKLATVAV